MSAPLLLGLAALTVAATAQAQTLQGCPQLPAESDLMWQHRATGAADFCRALRADGTEAFGLYISPEPTFDPSRSNREEAGVMDGREIHWYRAELAAQPDVEARETLIELRDGRMAHVWLQADSPAELQQLFQLTQALDFNPVPVPAIPSPETLPETQVAAGE
jgi:hypothetical protein